MTRLPPELPPLLDDGLPNLVYKYPGSWGGYGVYFMRARTQDQAIAIARQLDRKEGNNPPGLFQPFVCSRFLSGRRIYDVRCEMLVSPVGIQRTLAVKRESNKAIPEERNDGLITSKGVFTSNIETGGTVSPLTLEEEEEVVPAAEAVAEALARLLSRGFETLG
jgi:hypothetical protein